MAFFRRETYCHSTWLNLIRIHLVTIIEGKHQVVDKLLIRSNPSVLFAYMFQNGLFYFFFDQLEPYPRALDFPTIRLH